MHPAKRWRGHIAVGTIAVVVLACAFAWRLRQDQGQPRSSPKSPANPELTLESSSVPLHPARKEAAVPPEILPPGFVLFESGFAIRQDLVTKVDAAKEDIGRAKVRISAIASELRLIANRHGISLSRNSPWWDLHAAREKISSTSTADAERVGELLVEEHEVSEIAPAGFPFWAYVPPSTILSLFDVVETSENPLERSFWYDYLKGKLRLEATDVLDTETAPGTSAVKRSYYPMIIARLESWVSRADASAGDALILLRDALDTNLPEYSEICSRVGSKALALLLNSSNADSTREGAKYLSLRMTQEVRQQLFSELLNTHDSTRVIRLAAALPTTLSPQEAADLSQWIVRPNSTAAASTMLRVLSERLDSIQATAAEHPQSKATLATLDAHVSQFAAPLRPVDAAYYCTERLKGLGADDVERRKLIGHTLDKAIAALSGPTERLQMVGILGGLRHPEAPVLLQKLAEDAHPQVSQAAAATMVRFLYEVKAPTADTAIAKTLTEGREPIVLAVLDAFSRSPAPPSTAEATVHAIRRLADAGGNERIRDAARNVIRRIEGTR